MNKLWVLTIPNYSMNYCKRQGKANANSALLTAATMSDAGKATRSSIMTREPQHISKSSEEVNINALITCSTNGHQITAL